MGLHPRRDRPLVLFVGHVARLSGGEIALTRLVPVLLDDVDVHVVLGEDGPLVQALRQVGATVEVLPLDPRTRDVVRSSVTAGRLPVRQVVGALTYVLRLRRLLRALRPDLVHTNTLKAALYGGAAGRLAHVPVVWHVRDRIAPDYLPAPAVRLVRLLAGRLPSAVIANSEATLSTLPSVRRSAVVYNTVVPDSVKAVVEEPAARTGGPLVVGVVGRLAEWKGQHVFLDAFAQAFQGTDVRARLVGSALFGEDDYERRLRAQVRQLGIEGQVEFRGFREDTAAEYAALDVLVHCSTLPEPFGQVVVEGMASGLPVVAAAAGGPLEIVQDGVDGVLVPPGDAAALAGALRTLAADEQLRRRLARTALISARRFSPGATAAGVLGVYRSLLPAGSLAAP